MSLGTKQQFQSIKRHPTLIQITKFHYYKIIQVEEIDISLNPLAFLFSIFYKNGHRILQKIVFFQDTRAILCSTWFIFEKKNKCRELSNSDIL